MPSVVRSLLSGRYPCPTIALGAGKVLDIRLGGWVNRVLIRYYLYHIGHVHDTCQLQGIENCPASTTTPRNCGREKLWDFDGTLSLS